MHQGPEAGTVWGGMLVAKMRVGRSYHCLKHLRYSKRLQICSTTLLVQPQQGSHLSEHNDGCWRVGSKGARGGVVGRLCS